MRMTAKSFFSITAILLLVSCLCSCSLDFNTAEEPQTEPDKNSNTDYNQVDEALWSYFHDFETEAANRNISIDLNALEVTGVIENIEESGVAGTCQYGRHIHHVTIDQQFWNRASALLREMVVFHELGHCVLERGHEESENKNGICLSIMNSGTTDCFVNYNNNTKEYYLDELFSGLVL